MASAQVPPASSSGMRIVFQFDQAQDFVITFCDCSNHDNFSRAFLPSPSTELIGRSFFSLIPESEREYIRDVVSTLGPSNPVTMASHSFQESQTQNEKVSLKTVFCWVFQGGEVAKPLIQSVSQVWFYGFQTTKGSQALVNAALRNIPDMFFKISKEMVYVDYFAREEDMLVRPPLYLMGKTIKNVMPPDVGDTLERVCKEVLATKAPATTEYNIPIQGQLMWFEARIYTEKTLIEEDEEPHLIAMVRDITIQKNLEIELTRVSHMLQSIIDESPAIICVKNFDNSILLTNKCYDWLASKCENVQSFESLFLYQADEAYPTSVEAVIQDPNNGQELTFAIHKFVPSRDSTKGEIMCVLGMDITDRILFEKKIMQRAKELEVLNEKLRVAREMAEEAVRAKLMLMASLSHEIRTPLNGVIGTTSLLSSSELTNEQREMIETIHISGETLLQIINDLLDLAKMDSGKFELEKQPFSLLDCIEDVFNLLGTQAKDHGVELHYTFEKGVPGFVVGDILRLRQILLNLVSNAIKFSRRGFVIVRCKPSPDISTLPSSLPFETPTSSEVAVLFEVEDDGIGIPSKKIHELFQPFSQIDPSTSRNYGGTGLGLAICRRLTKLMKGNIWVESEENIGSVFSFQAVFDKTMENSRFMQITHDDRGSPLRPTVLSSSKLFLQTTKSWLDLWGVESAQIEISRNATAEEVGNLALTMRQTEGLGRQVVLVDDTGFGGHLQEGLSLLRGLLQQGWEVAFLSSQISPIGKMRVQADDSESAGVLERCVFFRKPFKITKFHHWLTNTQPGSSLEKGASLRWRKRSSVQEDDRGSKRLKERHFRALVAEDNQVNQQLLKKILSKLGCEVDLVEDGEKALEAVLKGKYDVVLMDINMPKMSGLEASRRIVAELPSSERPMLVAVTANALDENRKECILAGMDSFVPKPFVLGDVERILLDLEKRRG